MKTDKIREYIMVKDEFGHAKLEEVGCCDWNGELKYTDEMYKMLNKVFRMDSLITEVSYVIAFDLAKKVKGVCRIGQGDASETPISMQNIFTFLLLSGAASFVLVHNHISDLPKASDADKMITMKTNTLAMMFGMEFIGHMIINPNGYIIDGGTMDGTEEGLNEDSDSVDYDDYDGEDVFEDEDDEFEPFESRAATIHVTSNNIEEVIQMLREETEGK